MKMLYIKLTGAPRRCGGGFTGFSALDVSNTEINLQLFILKPKKKVVKRTSSQQEGGEFLFLVNLSTSESHLQHQTTRPPAVRHSVGVTQPV